MACGGVGASGVVVGRIRGSIGRSARVELSWDRGVNGIKIAWSDSGGKEGHSPRVSGYAFLAMGYTPNMYKYRLG